MITTLHLIMAIYGVCTNLYDVVRSHARYEAALVLHKSCLYWGVFQKQDSHKGHFQFEHCPRTGP